MATLICPLDIGVVHLGIETDNLTVLVQLVMDSTAEAASAQCTVTVHDSQGYLTDTSAVTFAVDIIQPGEVSSLHVDCIRVVVALSTQEIAVTAVPTFSWKTHIPVAQQLSEQEL